MEIQKEREVFEAYMAEKYKSLMDRRQCLNNGGGYMAWDMNVAWQVWQAATAQAVPEGFVLVPKEPTDKTIAHMINTPIEVNLLCDHADVFLSEGEAYIAYQAMIEAQEPAND